MEVIEINIKNTGNKLNHVILHFLIFFTLVVLGLEQCDHFGLPLASSRLKSGVQWLYLLCKRLGRKGKHLCDHTTQREVRCVFRFLPAWVFSILKLQSAHYSNQQCCSETNLISPPLDMLNYLGILGSSPIFYIWCDKLPTT